MSLLRRPFSSLWIVVPICALALIYWFNRVRVQRIETLSGLAGGEALVVDAKSPTGYAAGLRQLLLPERDGTSYQWVLQTQQMQAERTWHLRRTTYDNAPIGRPVTSASAYRWWLGAVAAVDRALFGHSSGIALENAAKWADPALHGLLLIVLTCLVAWLFNRWAAAVVALALLGLFPLSGNFAAGLPDDRGLGLGVMLTSLLLFLGAAHTTAGRARCGSILRRRGRCSLG
jgi:hypothetical protein